MSIFSRAVLTAALLSSWLLLLFVGWSLGGGIHILLLAALIAFPWRAVASSTDRTTGDQE